MIYLKNGERIEGVIEEESQDRVILNIGSGKIIFDKNEIDRIQRYNFQQQSNLKEKWEYKYFSQIEYIPDKLTEIADIFTNLEELREEAIESKRAKDVVADEISRLNEKIEKTSDKLAKVSKELSTFDPQEDIDKYNSLVEDFNSLQAKVKLYEYNKKTLEEKHLLLEKNISNYINQLAIFKQQLNKELSLAGRSPQEDKFLGILKDKSNNMSEDFTRHSIGYGKIGPNILVEAVINDLVKANLVVDTGASLVVISNRVADNLGLQINEDLAMSVILADGRSVDANPAVLKSIKVGDVEVKDVQAAVLEYQESVAEDGLLGMSFLENFIVKIDPKRGKLILEEFDP